MRATRVAAAAPNRRIIGGAGTCVPPVELDEPPLDEEELALLPELALEVEPEEPKLLDPPVAPELVLLEPLEAEEEADEADDALLPDEALLPELPDEPELPLLP